MGVHGRLTRTVLVAIAVAGALASPRHPAAQSAAPAAGSPPAESFTVRNTADLAALCGATGQDAGAVAAVHLCHGFLLGVAQYHAAVTQPGGAMAPLFCAPTPRLTVAQATAAFVAWARANPQHGGEAAVDGLMRWAGASFPCPPRVATAPDSRQRGR